MRIIIACLALLGSQLALAQPALYKGQVLTIPQGAVMDDAGTTYFESIQLQANEEGNFVLIAAEERGLATVESLDVLVMESLPLQISISVTGYTPTPCNELLTPAIFYKDNSFTVALAYSALGPAESCIAVIEPFTTAVPLEVAGLKAGTYQVSVNDVKTEFTLQTDN